MIPALLAALAAWMLIRVPPRRILEDPGGPSSSRRPSVDPLGTALEMDLLAAALAAGSTLPDALTVVASSGASQHSKALAELGHRLRSADPDWDDLPADLDQLRRMVCLITEAGVPASSLLRTAAADLRRRCARDAEIRAAKLGVRLVVPLGLCALPAFIAWSVVPVVLALAQDLL